MASASILPPNMFAKPIAPVPVRHEGLAFDQRSRAARLIMVKLAPVSSRKP